MLEQWEHHDHDSGHGPMTASSNREADSCYAVQVSRAQATPPAERPRRCNENNSPQISASIPTAEHTAENDYLDIRMALHYARAPPTATREAADDGVDSMILLTDASIPKDKQHRASRGTQKGLTHGARGPHPAAACTPDLRSKQPEREGTAALAGRQRYKTSEDVSLYACSRVSEVHRPWPKRTSVEADGSGILQDGIARVGAVAHQTSSSLAITQSPEGVAREWSCSMPIRAKRDHHLIARTRPSIRSKETALEVYLERSLQIPDRGKSKPPAQKPVKTPPAANSKARGRKGYHATPLTLPGARTSNGGAWSQSEVLSSPLRVQTIPIASREQADHDRVGDWPHSSSQRFLNANILHKMRREFLPVRGELITSQNVLEAGAGSVGTTLRGAALAEAVIAVSAWGVPRSPFESFVARSLSHRPCAHNRANYGVEPVICLCNDELTGGVGGGVSCVWAAWRKRTAAAWDTEHCVCRLRRDDCDWAESVSVCLSAGCGSTEAASRDGFVRRQ
ncbi:uncharacterized protein MYCGRDRAFT_97329 [Zymoseptoria tritici IPO323]|uniref:Uncharacterized protein n=1 Tax=Zymoseptoria tritici (strain CBS 115943 / IPO323) TaxID=336722 RepID=F9XPV5_ZYMTI|nr:uncharacterized protein MYCGRDRAFT_97329 [Zymoseptoria tritici IPO323]EGP82533.1 hypothetical protein MYCGRDRAFT_97329 [Zymoseptoria tritici IPO323]